MTHHPHVHVIVPGGGLLLDGKRWKNCRLLTDQNDSFDGNFATDDINVDAGGGDDTLTGGNSDNTLVGGSGDDLFNVGYGVDSIDGGTGIDTLSIADADDAINLTLDGDGQGFFNDDDGDSGTFTNIEAVMGSAGADTIDASGDTSGVALDGGAGDDTITGGAGNDTLVGGHGTDRVVFAGNHADYTFEVVGTDAISVTHTATGATDQVSAFEQIQFDDGLFDLEIGTAGDDNIATSGAGLEEDFVIGGDGNDTLNGGDGDDVYIGGAGDDLILSGPGADTVFGGAGNDTISLSDSDSLDGGTGSTFLTRPLAILAKRSPLTPTTAAAPTTARHSRIWKCSSRAAARTIMTPRTPLVTSPFQQGMTMTLL